MRENTGQDASGPESISPTQDESSANQVSEPLLTPESERLIKILAEPVAVQNPDRGTIFISGVGKRIGFYLAEYFLAQGFKVAGTYRRYYPSIESLSALGAKLYCCDFSDTKQVEQLTEQILAEHTELRAIIHNASDWLPDDNPLSAIATMGQMMAVHVSAPYHINLALRPLLLAGCQDEIGGRDIIHLTDYVAHQGSQKHIAYAASKAALANMTLSFAAKFAPQIKVNAIAPALVLFNEGDDDAYRQKTLAKALLPREAGMDEIINAINYLMSSRYVCGRTLHVDGGRHLK